MITCYLSWKIPIRFHRKFHGTLFWESHQKGNSTVNIMNFSLPANSTVPSLRIAYINLQRTTVCKCADEMCCFDDLVSLKVFSVEIQELRKSDLFYKLLFHQFIYHRMFMYAYFPVESFIFWKDWTKFLYELIYQQMFTYA